MRNLLPGIKKLEYCFADGLSLPELQLYQQGDTIAVGSSFFYPIELNGLAKCEIQDKIELGQLIYETKLTYFTQQDPVITNRFLCFRFTTVQNEQFLIGTGKFPFPVVTSKNTNPSSCAERRGTEVIISYKNIHSALRVGS